MSLSFTGEGIVKGITKPISVFYMQVLNVIMNFLEKFQGILVRKRFLRLKSFVSEEGGDFMLVQQKKDAPVKKMEVPLLAEEDIVTLRDRLSDLLDADLASMLDMDELRDKLAAPPAAAIPADAIQPDEGQPDETMSEEAIAEDPAPEKA
jgi:hypothetical protein